MTSTNDRNITESRLRVDQFYRWRIIEGTFRVLDADGCTWAARVSTTHLGEHGEQEREFPIIVSGFATPLKLRDESLPALAEWAAGLS
jgi:hypothetical protein